MDFLALMRTFVRTAETGSFTAVAEELRTTQPTVSRQVAALEEHLGSRLLARSTRSLTLTDDGRTFYEHALRTLEAADEAENAVGRRQARPSGLLRLSVPLVFGRLHLVPRLNRFLDQYPDISIDLHMTDGLSDLVEQGIDLAVRVGEITDPNLVTRRISTVQRVTVAAADYLKRRGTPHAPQDLADHDCIVYTRLATRNRWHFDGPDGPQWVDVSGPFRSDSSEGVREGVLSGMGIAVIPAFAFTREIADGRVTVILEGHEPGPSPINAVYPSRRLVASKVRAMIDFLVTEYRSDPPA